MESDRSRCAYCGEPATSDDHVPPKCLFAGDRTNLITVPSCDKHNNRRSGLDERFREFVSLSVGQWTATTQALWQPTLRSIRRNRKRKAELVRNSLWAPELDAYVVKVDAPVFHQMIEQITRGLYWHCYNQEALPLDVKIGTHMMRMGDWMPPFVQDMARAIVGDDQFFYAYKRMDEHPTISVWVYVFHRRLAAMAFTDEELIAKVMPAPQARAG